MTDSNETLPEPADELEDGPAVEPETGQSEDGAVVELEPDAAERLEPAGDPEDGPTEVFSSEKPAKKGKSKLLIAIAVALVLLLGGGFAGLRVYESNLAAQSQASLDSQQWAQAEATCDQALKLEATRLMRDAGSFKVMRGEARFHQGKTEAALADLQAAQTLLPADPRPYLYQAQIFIQQGKLDAALKAAEDLQELDPGAGLLEAIQAYQAFQQNQFAEALAAAEQAIQLNPEIGLAYLVRGGVRVLNDHIDEATADLDRTLELDPDQPEALALRAFALLSANQTERGKHDSERLKTLAPGSTEDLFAQSVVLAHEQKIPEANRLISQVIEQAPDFPLYYMMRAYTYISAADYPKQLDDLEQALKRYADLPDAISLKATILFQMYKPVDMQAEANRVLGLAPQDNNGHQMLIQYYLRELEFEKAEAEANLIIEADAEAPEGYWSRATVYVNQAKYAEALQDYQKAIDLNPKFSSGYLGLAGVHQAERRFDEALQAAEKAQELIPYACGPLVAKASILMQKKDKENAQKALDEAFKLDPACEEGLALRAGFYLQDNDPMNAMSDVNKLSDMYPEHPNWMLLRARVYLANQDVDKAMAELDKADKINFKIADSFLLRSQAYRMKDELDQSNDVLLRGTQFFPWNASMHAALSDTNWLMGNDQRAIEEGKKALELDDQLYNVHISMAIGYWNKGDIESAIESMAKIKDFEDELDVTQLDAIEKTMVFLKSVPKAVDGKRSLEDKENNFRMSYKTNWIPRELDGDLDDLYVYQLEYNEAFGAVTLNVMANKLDGPVPAGLGSAGVMADYTKYAMSTQENIQYVDRKVIQAANTQGYADTVIIEMVDDRGQRSSVSSRQYYFVSSQYLVALVFTAPTYLFDRYVEKADEVASTIAFIEP